MKLGIDVIVERIYCQTVAKVSSFNVRVHLVRCSCLLQFSVHALLD